MATDIPESEIPLAVDLDGTLVREDVTKISMARYLRSSPLAAPRVLYWLGRYGWARCKAEVAARVTIDTTVLTYHPIVVEWIKLAKRDGRKVYLATATHERYAAAVCSHLPLFDDYLASDQHVIYSDVNKRDALIAHCGGERRFDYVGNSRADLPVWQAARLAYVVGAPRGVLKEARLVSQVTAVID